MKPTVTSFASGSLLFALLLMTASCVQKTPAKEVSGQQEPLPETAVLTKDSVPGEPSEEFSEEDAWQECYMVVADTGKDYYALRGMLDDIKRITGQGIDTFGRYYNDAKDSLILHEDDEDEMWAGAYFPRRDLTPAGSIEYLDAYRQTDSANRMMAAIAGQFVDKNSADSTLSLIRGQYQHAWVMKTKVYMGCMH